MSSLIPRSLKVSPSDLTYLVDCPRCLQRKLRDGVRQPSIPLPSVFNQIHNSARLFFDGQRTELAGCGLLPGTFRHGEMWIESQPLNLPELGVGLFFKGRIDMAVEFDDGSWGLIDFKTISPKDAHSERYRWQLHAYVHALEHPASRQEQSMQVSQLGLICFTHGAMQEIARGNFAFAANSTWIPVPRQDEDFLELLRGVAEVATRETEAPSGPNCDWCKFLKLAA